MPTSFASVFLHQAVFSLLDVLQRWSEDAKALALRTRTRGEHAVC